MAVKIKATGPGKCDVTVSLTVRGTKVDEILAQAQTEIGLKRAAEKEATRRPLKEARVKITGSLKAKK